VIIIVTTPSLIIDGILKKFEMEEKVERTKIHSFMEDDVMQLYVQVYGMKLTKFIYR